jgi:hypothetical protein
LLLASLRQHNTYLPMGELIVRENALGTTQSIFLNDVELAQRLGFISSTNARGITMPGMGSCCGFWGQSSGN